MNKLTLLAALGLLTLIPVASAQAEEHMEAAPAVEATTEAPVEAKEMTLKDGTKVVVEGDMVSVVAEDGTKTPAPDGEHELEDGTKITVTEGKLVH